MSVTPQQITNLSAQEKRALIAELLKKSKRPRIVATSFAQQRLWFLQQLEPESTSYNLPLAVRLSGRLDQHALRRSLNEIVRRHEALRTTFVSSEAGPVQVIHPAMDAPLPLIDLSLLPEVKRESETERLSTEESSQPFDLAAGWACRWAPDNSDAVDRKRDGRWKSTRPTGLARSTPKNSSRTRFVE